MEPEYTLEESDEIFGFSELYEETCYEEDYYCQDDLWGNDLWEFD